MALAATLPEYSLEIAARITEAAAHRFQGEGSDILENIRQAVITSERHPADIVDFLSLARGCYLATELYRERGDMDGFTGTTELWRLFLTWGDMLVCNAMSAFMEMPEADALMWDMHQEFGHLSAVRWRRGAWMHDLSVALSIKIESGEVDGISHAEADTAKTRTAYDLCGLLIAIRATKGAAACFRYQGRNDEAARQFAIGQKLIDKAAETCGWLVVEAVAHLPKH